MSFRINTWEDHWSLFEDCNDPTNPISLKFCARLSFSSHWYWASSEIYFQEVMELSHGSLIWFHSGWKSATSMYGSSFPLRHIWSMFDNFWFDSLKNSFDRVIHHLIYRMKFLNKLYSTYTNNASFSLFFFHNLQWLLKKKVKKVLWFLLPTKVKTTFMSATSLQN